MPPSLPPVAALLVSSLLLAAAVSGDCPPRTPEEWEHNSRSDVLKNYVPLNTGCPQVNIALFPERIVVGRDITTATMDAAVILDWRDPGLVWADAPEKSVKFKASEIWTPQLVTGSSRRLAPESVTAQSIDAVLLVGAVSSMYRTTIEGMCYPRDWEADDWPRDSLLCHFAVRSVRPMDFTLSHPLSVPQLDEMRKKLGLESTTERLMSSWKVTKIKSAAMNKFNTSALVVSVTLQRLPAQLEAEVVHPMCLASVLAPASAALPPWSEGRPVLLATAFLLHSMLLLFLPYLEVAAADPSLPPSLLLYRDAGLLLLLVLLQWLLSLRLASRRKPLAGWLRSGARALATLRTPLLLSAVPAQPPAPTPRGLDEESLGLSEVLDRLALLAAGAALLAFVGVSLQ